MRIAIHFNIFLFRSNKPGRREERGWEDIWEEGRSEEGWRDGIEGGRRREEEGGGRKLTTQINDKKWGTRREGGREGGSGETEGRAGGEDGTKSSNTAVFVSDIIKALACLMVLYVCRVLLNSRVIFPTS